MRLWRVWLAGGEGVAWGVVLGCWPCAAVGVFMVNINSVCYDMSVGESVVVGEYGVREVVMFLLKLLGGRVYSVKKLMKLVFLAQYDVDAERRVVYEYRRPPPG
jgi:hypothetical protein